MKIAITVWGNRISPVFDSAQTLLVAEVRETEVINRQIELFQAGVFSRFIELLAELEVQVLICGALSDEPAAMLAANEIEVIPFVTGKAEAVLSLYVRGMDLADFTMPGCPRNRCCGTNHCPARENRTRK
ncbi:MAG: NifB/NifX family molybdenum-iron cluster-binding protein [Desulfobulbaceae bacterium]|nr:NifB/NifX family molybdenum-iron cluster-binding protein [Desulfobulbaceae bacterium]